MVLYDKIFSKDMSCKTERMAKSACKICKTLSSNEELVQRDGAQCFPDDVQWALEQKFPHDCQDLPKAKSKKIKSVFVIKNASEVEWFAMAFSSVNMIFLTLFRLYQSHVNDADFAVLLNIYYSSTSNCPIRKLIFSSCFAEDGSVIDYLYRGYYTVARRYEYYFQVIKTWTKVQKLKQTNRKQVKYEKYECFSFTHVHIV